MAPMTMRRWDDHAAPRAGLSYTARLDPKNIAYLVCLLEAYDGLAVVRTKDAALGIVEFWISPLMQKDFESFLESAGQELNLHALPPVVIDMAELGEP
jgi:hypothetical protein